jgi:ATP-binding cassette subfamily B protein
LSTIREADQILVIDDGRVRERGTHDELLIANGLYAELCRTQFARQAAGGPAEEPAEPRPEPEPVAHPYGGQSGLMKFKGGRPVAVDHSGVPQGGGVPRLFRSTD